MTNWDKDFKESTLHETHKTPDPVRVDMPLYPKKFDHPFTTCYGLDVLAQEIYERLTEIEKRLNNDTIK